MGRLKLPLRLRKPKKSRYNYVTSTTHLALVALQESSDAFPPLKSAVGAVMHVVQLCQKVKSNKEGCQRLSDRSQEILFMIADAIPDATQIPSELLRRIELFVQLLDDIHKFMQAHCTRLTIARLLSHVEDEAMISDLSRRLDEAFASFMFISVIKTELSLSAQSSHLSEIASKAEQRHNDTMLSAVQLERSLKVYTFVLFDQPPPLIPPGVSRPGIVEGTIRCVAGG